MKTFLDIFLFQYEYKKSFKQNKGFYHFVLDTAEQIHHKESAVLHSGIRNHKYILQREKCSILTVIKWGTKLHDRLQWCTVHTQSEAPHEERGEVFGGPKPIAEAWQWKRFLTLFSNSDITIFEETNKSKWFWIILNIIFWYIAICFSLWLVSNIPTYPTPTDWDE